MCYFLLRFGRSRAVCTLLAWVKEEERMLTTKVLSGHYGFHNAADFVSTESLTASKRSSSIQESTCVGQS
jgi:hypothetical protein